MDELDKCTVLELFSRDGLVHPASPAVQPDKPCERCLHRRIRRDRKNNVGKDALGSRSDDLNDIETCLCCTEEKCSGVGACVRRHTKKRLERIKKK